MRRIALILTALVLSAPAWADVEIRLTDLGDGVIEISYNATSETELVRAFALDIVATDGNIVAIDNYSIGDDNGGYGIFPGNFAANITVNPTTGQVDSWGETGYTPIAPAGDPDALGQIPGPAITIEMGSLYDTAAPSHTGVLCTITVDENVTKVCVTGNAMRGNIVLEDASEATMAGDVDEVCLDGCPDCFPCENPGYDDWVAFGKPSCWCYARQCRGDADGLKQGSAVLGYTYVSTNDLIRLANAWQIKEPPKGPGILIVPSGICADFDHDKQGSAALGYVRVSTNDLIKLANSWQIKEPPKGPGIPGDCANIPIEP